MSMKMFYVVFSCKPKVSLQAISSSVTSIIFIISIHCVNSTLTKFRQILYERLTTTLGVLFMMLLLNCWMLFLCVMTDL